MMGVINQTRNPINRVIPRILSIIEAVIPGKHSMGRAFPRGDRSLRVRRVHRATALLMEYGRFGNNPAKVS
jgi:hypothetical protein